MAGRIGWFIPVVAIAMFSTQAIMADETDLKHEVASLLELGWEPSPQAQVKAKQQAFKLVGMAPDDSRIAYAYVIVQVRQRKYPEADLLLNRVLIKEKDNLYALRTKIWLCMHQKQYDVALLGLKRLSDLLAADAPSTTVNENDEVRLEMAAFIGRMMAYLTGPAQENRDPLSIETQQEKIFSALSVEHQEAFIDGRDSVANRYAELSGETTRIREQELAEAEAGKREVQEALAMQEQRVALERAEVEPLREKTQSEFGSRMADLESGARPLIERMSQLEAQAAIIQRQRMFTANDINNLRELAANTDDPYEHDRLLRRSDQLSIDVRRFELDLTGLDREAAGVRAQHSQLLVQQRQLQDRFRADMGRLAGRIEIQQQELKKKAADQRRLVKSVSGTSPRVRELARLAIALESYEPLALERERARLLASFE